MPGQPFDDRALQSAYQGWMRADRGDHLDDGAWQRLGAGDAAPSERDLLFAHIMTCAQCSEVWRGISFLRQQAEEEGLIERRAHARPSWRSWFVPAAIAASLVVVIGGAIVTRQPAPADNVVRGTAALSPVEGLMMAYASDGTPMLLWTPLAAASTYRVEIFSEDGNPLWSGDVAAPPMRWPSGAPHARGSYRWRVEAQDGGSAIARSRLTAVELTR
jgi:hypothetical protein